MSITVKYSTGSTYTLVANSSSIPIVQGVAVDHIYGTDQSLSRATGLEWGKVTISGDILDKAACLWDDIVAISYDAGTSYQDARSMGVEFQNDQWSGIYPYSLTLMVSPLRYGSTHTSSTYWGWTTATVPAATGAGLMRLSYQGPTRFWPLQNSLASVDGVNLTYTGIPVFSNGLVIGAGVKASASITAKSLLMRLLFSSPWIIGGSAPNLLTANQSNAGTDTTGMEAVNGTIARTNGFPPPVGSSYAFEVYTITNINAQIRATYTNVTAGAAYVFSAYTRALNAAGRHVLVRIEWFNAASASLGTLDSSSIVLTNAYARLLIGGTAPATTTKCKVSVVFPDSTAVDGPLASGFMLQAMSSSNYLWQSAHNSCSIDMVAGAVKWFDGTTTISRTIDLAGYLAGGTLDVIAIDDVAEVLVVVQAGTATTATDTLAALTWGTLNIGSDGSANEAMAAISCITAYPYVLVSAEYGALHLTVNPLLMGTYSTYFRSSGTVVVNNQGRLIDAVGNDVSAGMAGSIPKGVSGAAGSLVMSDGLSARWQVLIDDTWRV
jgi:hypothetical protein